MQDIRVDIKKILTDVKCEKLTSDNIGTYATETFEDEGRFYRAFEETLNNSYLKGITMKKSIGGNVLLSGQGVLHVTLAGENFLD